MKISMKKLITLLTFVFFILSANSVAKENKYTVQLEMKDGDLIPLVLEVPAKTKIRIEVKNIGTQPAEFESTTTKRKSFSTWR